MFRPCGIWYQLSSFHTQTIRPNIPMATKRMSTTCKPNEKGKDTKETLQSML